MAPPRGACPAAQNPNHENSSPSRACPHLPTLSSGPDGPHMSVGKRHSSILGAEPGVEAAAGRDGRRGLRHRGRARRGPPHAPGSRRRAGLSYGSRRRCPLYPPSGSAPCHSGRIRLSVCHRSPSLLRGTPPEQGCRGGSRQSHRGCALTQQQFVSLSASDSAALGETAGSSREAETKVEQKSLRAVCVPTPPRTCPGGRTIFPNLYQPPGSLPQIDKSSPELRRAKIFTVPNLIGPSPG